MKKRIKYILIISFLLLLSFGLVNSYMNARDRSLETERRDREKEDRKNKYIIKRDSNLYTLTSDKLIGKTLKNSFYDGTSIYLLYTDNNNGTLLKYIVSTKEVVVLFENNESLKDGIEKIYGYYKIGSKLYDKNFEKSIYYPNINDGEYLLKDLKSVIYNKDDGVYTKNLETGEETNILLNTDINKYRVTNVDNISGYSLVERESEGKKYIDILDNEFHELMELEENSDKKESYKLINNGDYLLKETKNEDGTLYKIYNSKDSSNIFTSNKDVNNLIFNDTKYIANKDGAITLNDFTTGEERVLIAQKDNNARWLPKNFIMADDEFSLFLMLDNNDRKFYLIYL